MFPVWAVVRRRRFISWYTVCARHDEATVVMRPPELRVGGDGVEAFRNERDVKEGGFAHVREDSDKDFV